MRHHLMFQINYVHWTRHSQQKMPLVTTYPQITGQMLLPHHSLKSDDLEVKRKLEPQPQSLLNGVFQVLQVCLLLFTNETFTGIKSD